LADDSSEVAIAERRLTSADFNFQHGSVHEIPSAALAVKTLSGNSGIV
jgi:hypothetical protein